MPKEKLLTDVEKEQIVALHYKFLSPRAISEAVGRSVEVIGNFLEDFSLCKDQFKKRNATKVSLV